ncbi:MAG TPA: hypothetical protein VL687_03975 [Methylomirabilota bacterium]|jgi:hypothetical protein|nr:hypothetical protein [Methylomirabilota bacterium]
MRHLRPFAALVTVAALTVACGSSPGSGGESQGAEPSTGSQPSQAAASSGGGGGGGGGGANGSVTYEITGDYQASGELPFLAGGLSLWVESAGGWVANFANQSGEGPVILINTQAAEGTPGQIFTYGDTSVIMTAISTAEAGNSCTFNLTKNDSTGLAGDVHCDSAIASDVSSGAQKHVQLTAHWDAHP